MALHRITPQLPVRALLEELVCLIVCVNAQAQQLLSAHRRAQLLFAVRSGAGCHEGQQQEQPHLASDLDGGISFLNNYSIDKVI
jgi:hypothetical protein